MSADLGKQPGEPRVRASDAEREAVVERLREATADGRLTLEELADRCEAAYLARYRDDLDRVAADLPQPQPQPQDAAPGAGSAPAALGGAAGAAGAAGVYRTRVGDATYDSPVPDASGRLTATAGLGDLTLNLAHARAPSSGGFHVTAKAWGGDVRLIVPEGVRLSVEGDVRDRTGRRRQQLRELPEDAPRVHVAATSILGDVIVERPQGGRSSLRQWIEEAVDRALEFL